MYIDKLEERKQVIIFPNADEEGNFNANKLPSVVVSHNNVRASLIHRRMSSNNFMQIVPFMDMSKEELQTYINELQEVCNKMS